jgi:hypothetical protein
MAYQPPLDIKNDAKQIIQQMGHSLINIKSLFFSNPLNIGYANFYTNFKNQDFIVSVVKDCLNTKAIETITKIGAKSYQEGQYTVVIRTIKQYKDSQINITSQQE